MVTGACSRWWQQETPYGTITVVVGDLGVRRITLPSAGDEPSDPVGWPGRPGPTRPDRRIESVLAGWFTGRRRVLDLPVDLDDLTPFRREVLTALAREVPWGETVTYGELAALAGRPGAARAVGTTLAANPVPFIIPCHRVTAATGIGGFGGRADRVGLKRALLDRERASRPR
ncbi:MAG: methylated-DNA--[protein]-cysteine S-methyltransferase [Actinomycetota bacterium]